MTPQGVRRLFTLAGWLSLPATHALGTLIGLVAAAFPNRMRQVTRRNLELCFPQHSVAERKRLERQSLIETGKTLCEAPIFWRKPRQTVLDLVRESPGIAAVQQAHSEGRGIVLLTPHFGAWELGGLYCSSQWPMTILYKPPKQAALDDPIREGRARFGAAVVPTDASGVRALLRGLKNAEAVGILPDQEPTEGEGVFAPFLGHLALTMTLPMRLVARTRGERQARVFLTITERLPRARGFRQHFMPVEDAIYSDDMQLATAALNRGVEACLRVAPEQYQWSYKRFRRRPEGSAEIY
ncbi:MAG TPA: lipid A biosynthesis acyltransferase [bacterium]|nr:lipid A biosynthesis acyltransferase [bacterium]